MGRPKGKHPMLTKRGLGLAALGVTIGTAARATIGAAAVRSVGLPAAAPTSSTVPQAWHSPQRPTQRTAVQPHSAQR